MFECSRGSSEKCVLLTLVCDGNDDCGDAADEAVELCANHSQFELLTPCSVTTFLEFPEMSANLAKVRERRKDGERSGNLCSQGNLIVAAKQYNLRALYLYCNYFSYVMLRIIWINKCASV